VEVDTREGEATAASGQLEWKEGLAKRLFPSVKLDMTDNPTGEGNLE
jgi:hypothetical protein